MPFVALARPKGNHDIEPKRVNIRTLKNPRLDLIDYETVCQACGDKMYIRHSVLSRAHFAHNPDPDRQCAYDKKGGETPEHRASKAAVFETLNSRPEYRGAHIDEESYIKKVDRTVDVLVRHSDGAMEAHEVQLASCSATELEERTRDYESAGIAETIWWLGKAANNEPNRNWCKNRYGYVATLEIDTSYSTVELGKHAHSG